MQKLKCYIVKFLFWFIANSIIFLQPSFADRFEIPELLNTYGMPGSIDTPVAKSLPEGQLSISSSVFGGTIRTNLSFQITDKLVTSFRYSRVPALHGDHSGYYWDRSFDLQYLLSEEKKSVPSIAFGLRDFIGTGIYSGEYFVASKQVSKKILFTAGIGWGRFAGKNSFSNIFGASNERTTLDAGFGGTIHVDQFFSGTNSPFFSIDYRINENISLLAEYSSDGYILETSSGRIKRNSDINIALKYKLSPDFSIMGQFMHGDTVGLAGALAINPKNRPFKSSIEPAPMPILSDEIITQTQRLMDDNIFNRSSKLLELDGINLISLEIKEKFLEADISDRNYRDVSQMVGRVARIFSKTIPVDINSFQITIVDYYSGLSVSKLTIDRESVRKNELEFDGPEMLWKGVKIENAKMGSNHSLFLSKKRLSWSLYPDLELMLFDPHSPINGSLGWEARSAYLLGDSTIINSSIKQPLITGLDDIKRKPKSSLPHVRSSFMYYYRDIGTSPYINNLTIDQYFKPLKNIYSQINIGYLEMMYAGVRSETIWKDARSPFGIGLDLAAVRKRDTVGDFSILNESYSSAIGTVYYDYDQDWNFKIDIGKYLAGDYGATLGFSRTFNNGWEIGAYATLTDAKFSSFGEGSFDKGITLIAPLDWFTGKKSKDYRKSIIRPIAGDGGARLLLEDDKLLYGNLKAYDEKSFKDNWKRFYR